ncbi:hypothetical protein V6N12_069233 [Hibiscus sabdariffa]|uniref:Uncharacterized protein n=1 Tax=Hibiscus sabdariffa TaxID=183260 RepID=A0ABR2FDP5_9ROSI
MVRASCVVFTSALRVRLWGLIHGYGLCGECVVAGVWGLLVTLESPSLLGCVCGGGALKWFRRGELIEDWIRQACRLQS